KIIIHRHQWSALLDRSHRSDEDALYAFLPECLKESAERAVLRLKWHRSWGDIAKNSACCQRSLSSILSTSARCSNMRAARSRGFLLFRTRKRCRLLA